MESSGRGACSQPYTVGVDSSRAGACAEPRTRARAQADNSVPAAACSEALGSVSPGASIALGSDPCCELLPFTLLSCDAQDDALSAHQSISPVCVPGAAGGHALRIHGMAGGCLWPLVSSHPLFLLRLRLVLVSAECHILLPGFAIATSQQREQRQISPVTLGGVIYSLGGGGRCWSVTLPWASGAGAASTGSSPIGPWDDGKVGDPAQPLTLPAPQRSCKW